MCCVEVETWPPGRINLNVYGRVERIFDILYQLGQGNAGDAGNATNSISPF